MMDVDYYDNELLEHALTIIDQTVRDYRLDHGNYRVDIEDGYIFVFLEAPNKSMQIAMIGIDELEEKETDKDLRGFLVCELSSCAKDFDAEKYFQWNWCPSLAETKGVSMFQFIRNLLDDEKFFTDFVKAAQEETER